jgi:WD40 repeat protein
MNTIIQANLNSKEPWPGLAWFEEADRPFFRGRADETAELLRLVRREPLTVLFGRSGLGKTSLLKAGLFPALRSEELLPVYVRLEHAIAAPPLRDQVWQALAAACGNETTQTSKPLPAEELWTYFHRRDAEFWSQLNRPVMPVIVFDQFEEIFTLGEFGESLTQRSAEFLAELADLVENRPPASVKKLLEQDPSAANKYEFRRATVKLVLSFREDFLAEIEQLKPQMPSLMINRLRLLPMNGTQAYAVITEAGSSLVADEDARRLLQLAWKNKPEPPVDPAEFPQMEIDPALLSVVCRELNSKRLAAQPPLQRITADLMRGADRKILKGFYERGMEGLDPGVGIFVEEELITQQGYRDSRDWEDAQAKPGVTSEALELLVRRRLLRADERQGRRRLELTHDVLAKVVMERRDQRRADARAKQQEEELRKAAEERQREQVRRKKKERLLILGIASSVVLAACMFFLTIRAEQQKNEAEKQKNEAQSHVARIWAAVSEGLLRDYQVDPESSIEFALAALNRSYRLEPFETTKLIVNLVNAIDLYGRHSVSRGESQVSNWSLAAIGNNQLVSAGEDGSFIIWSTRLEKYIGTREANLKDPVFLRLANGNIIAGGFRAKYTKASKGKTIPKDVTGLQLWNSGLINMITEMAFKPGIKFMKELPSNGYLVVVDFDGQPWRLKRDLSENLSPLPFNSNSVITSLTVLNSGDNSEKILISVKDGNNLRLEIWSADLLKRLAYTELNDEVTSLIQLNDRKIVSGSKNGSLQLWDSKLKRIGPSIEAQSRAILSLAQLDSGELISGSADGTLSRLRVSEYGLSAFHLPFPANQSKVRTLLELQSSLISGGSNGLIKKWEWEKDSSANNASRKTNEDNVVMVTPIRVREGEIFRLRPTTSSTAKGKYFDLEFGSAEKKPVELTRTRLKGPERSTILSILLLKDGDLATGHQDGTVQRWKFYPKGKFWFRTGDAYRLDPSKELGGIWSMAELHNGDVVLGLNRAYMLLLRFNGGKWLVQGKPCKPPTKDVPSESLGNQIYSLATLTGRDLVSGSSNGTIVRWDRPDKQWCMMRSIALDKESLPIFSMTELSERTMLSATEKGGLTMWKWKKKLETPPLWKFWRWKTGLQDKVQDIDTLANLYWKGPGQQIASVATLPNQKGFVVADFTGRSKIYPDRDEAIRRGCYALQKKFNEEKDHKNLTNQASKLYQKEARQVCGID